MSAARCTAHITGYFIAFTAGFLAALFMFVLGDVPSQRDDLWRDSDFLDTQAATHPVYRLLRLEKNMHRYADMLRSGSSPEELAPFAELLITELEYLIDLDEFPLPWRARRLLSEILNEQNRFGRTIELLSPYADLASPTNKYEKSEYLDCLLRLGAALEVTGRGQQALAVYTDYLKSSTGHRYDGYATRRLERIASSIESGSPYPAVSPEDAGIHGFLKPLAGRIIVHPVPVQGQ